MRAEYRYFWDNWDIHAHTAEVGHSRYLNMANGEKLLLDGFVRYYTQGAALFYSDNAGSETEFVSRNRQLSSFRSLGVGARLTYTLAQVPGRYEVKANGAYEFKRFDYKDFTDLRTGSPFAFDAHLLQQLAGEAGHAAFMDDARAALVQRFAQLRTQLGVVEQQCDRRRRISHEPAPPHVAPGPR